MLNHLSINGQTDEVFTSYAAIDKLQIIIYIYIILSELQVTSQSTSECK